MRYKHGSFGNADAAVRAAARDLVGAESILQDAFVTDVRPAIRERGGRPRGTSSA